MFTTALIPTNGVYITEAYSPKGYYVARYDHKGLTSQGRWFPTMKDARGYAKSLTGPSDTAAFAEHMYRKHPGMFD